MELSVCPSVGMEIPPPRSICSDWRPPLLPKHCRDEHQKSQSCTSCKHVCHTWGVLGAMFASFSASKCAYIFGSSSSDVSARLTEEGGCNCGSRRLGIAAASRRHNSRLSLPVVLPSTILLGQKIGVRIVTQHDKVAAAAAAQSMYPSFAERGSGGRMSAEKRFAFIFDGFWRCHCSCNCLLHLIHSGDVGVKKASAAHVRYQGARVALLQQACAASPGHDLEIYAPEIVGFHFAGRAYLKTVMMARSW